jgi:hypothetical protein
MVISNAFRCRVVPKSVRNGLVSRKVSEFGKDFRERQAGSLAYGEAGFLESGGWGVQELNLQPPD